ncbi:MAG: transporter substrate-binding domain-containing protein [Clostridiaceae bacterium]|nr:transporter substrate-binding domain-containing protein [Clostridiaceae bacterium]
MKMTSKLKKKTLICLVVLMLLLMHSSLHRKVSSQTKETTSSDPIEHIKVAVDPNMPPLQYVEGEDYLGFHIDILESVGDIYNIDISYVPMPVEKVVEAIEQKEVDAAIGINFLSELSENLIFTDSISTSSVGLIVENKHINSQEDVLELTDMVITLKRDSVEYQYLQNVRRVKYNTTSNIADAFQLLEQERGNALMGDRLVAQQLMEQYNLDNKYTFINSYIIPIEYAIVVGKDNYNLLTKFNDGIQQIKESGVYGEIYAHWFLDKELVAEKRLRQLLKVFIVFIMMAAILSIVGIRWNKQLKRQVDKKTQELQTMNENLAYQITETKNKNEMINQLLESSPRGLIIIEKNGIIASCNPTVVELIGLENNSTGRYYNEVPFIRQLLQEKIGDVIEKEVQFSGEEVNWQREDGKKYDIRYMVYPLRSYDRKVKGIIVSFEDITQEKKLREEWFEREKSRALNEIVAGISHEIRNPLTSIKTFVELLPKKFDNPQFRRDITTYVPKEVERVNQLIESLINYAKPRKPNKEIVDIKDLVEYNIRLFTPIIEQKGLKVTIDMEKNLKVNVDKAQMKQVMMNFFLNGIEAMEEIQQDRQLTLSIRGWRHQEHIYISIKDEGVGMTQKEIIHALNPFYTTKATGTGLGIPLSKQYIEDNDGQLTIESEKNVGTKLILRFEGRD